MSQKKAEDDPPTPPARDQMPTSNRQRLDPSQIALSQKKPEDDLPARPKRSNRIMTAVRRRVRKLGLRSVRKFLILSQDKKKKSGLGLGLHYHEELNIKNDQPESDTEKRFHFKVESDTEKRFHFKVKEEWSEFLKASYNGDIEKAKSLFKGGEVFVDEEDADGTTALMIASDYGHTKMVKLLLEKGAHVDVQNKDGWSALMRASKVQVAQILLIKGASIDLKNNDGLSALITASQIGRTGVVSVLLKNGALIDIQSNNGSSALMEASQNGHIEVVRLLLQYEAPVYMKDNNGSFALIEASQKGHTEVAKLLLDRGAHINAQDDKGSSALMGASREGHTEVAKLLLERGAHIDAQDDKGSSALMGASREGHTEVAKLLLERGAHIDIQDDNGSSALMEASRKDHTEVIQLLLQEGANAEKQDNAGKSALMIASESGSKKIGLLLLKNGSQVDLRDEKGKTALMYASSNNKIEITFLLLKNGSNVNLQDNDGWFPLMYAIKAGDAGTCALLLAYSPDLYLKNFEGDTILSIYPEDGSSVFQDLPILSWLYSHIPMGLQSWLYSHISILLVHYLQIWGAMAIKASREKGEIPGHTPKFHGEDEYYSVRLYRGLSLLNEASAVFYMCLYDSDIIELCDNRIIDGYTDNNMMIKWERQSTISAKIISDEVIIRAIDNVGWNIIFDIEPPKIFKKDIGTHQVLKIKVSNLPDYPPKIIIHVKATGKVSSRPPRLQIIGLDKECSFVLPIPKLPHLDQPQVESYPPTELYAMVRGPATIGEYKLSTVDDSTLGSEDLDDVLDAVERLSPKWKRLAIKLHIDKYHTEIKSRGCSELPD